MPRDTDYKDSYPQELIDIMSKGAKGAPVFAHFGISRKTFYNWLNKHPAFNDAYEKGWEAAEKWWHDFGVQKMLEGDEAGYKYWQSFVAKNFGYGRNENAQAGPQINIGNVNVFQGQSKDELISFIQEGLKELNVIEAQFQTIPQDIDQKLLDEPK